MRMCAPYMYKIGPGAMLSTMKITNALPKEEVLHAGRSTCVAYFV